MPLCWKSHVTAHMSNERPYACAKSANYSCSGSLSASIKYHQPLFMTEIRENPQQVSEYDQEIPQTYTAD